MFKYYDIWLKILITLTKGHIKYGVTVSVRVTVRLRGKGYV